MAEHTLLSHFFILRPGLTIVGVWIDADTTSGSEQAHDLNVLRIHKPHQVFHDDVHTILVEIAIVAEREEIKL